MKFVYGWGASIVLLGALFKIQHWPGGGVMLTLGMSTEVIIFFLSAFEPLHEEVDWTLVYPELAGMTDDFEPKDRDERDRRGRSRYHDDRLINLSEMPAAHSAEAGATAQSFSIGETFGTGLQGLKAIEQFDTLLAQADLTPEMFQKLGEGIHKVGDIAQKFSNIDQTIDATGEFSQKLTFASKSVGNLADSCQNGAEAIKSSVINLSSAYNQSSELINNTSQQVAGAVQDGIKTMVGALNDAGTKLIQIIGNSDH
ncbi:MAG TPA: gliding motility protein GldL, partial [Salinivirgaceae bacterium]|nr:gliding motility protein GldL [Salinivirgaceae bacterium]